MDPTVDIIRSQQALEALRPEWDALHARCDAKAFFNDHRAVMLNWARHRKARSNSLHIVTMRQSGELVFAAPMIQQRDRIGTSTLKWLTSLTPLYDDVLIAPEADVDVIAGQFARHVRSIPFARKLKASIVREDSSLNAILSSMGPVDSSEHPALEADLKDYADRDAYFADKPAKSRKRYRLYFNRLSQLGETKFNLHGADSGLRSEISWIFDVKRDWAMERSGDRGWISQPETEHWFQSFSEDLPGKSGAVTLTCGDKRVVSALFYVHQDTLFGSKIAYDPEFSHASPGLLLMVELCRVAIDLGMRRVDIMTGDSSWKRRFATHSVPINSYRLSLGPWRLHNKKWL